MSVQEVRLTREMRQGKLGTIAVAEAGAKATQLEQALRVRLDFMVFTGFDLSAGE